MTPQQLDSTLTMLVTQRAHIDRAITALQKLKAPGTPATPRAASAGPSRRVRRGRRAVPDAERKAISQRMTLIWANRRETLAAAKRVTEGTHGTEQTATATPE